MKLLCTTQLELQFPLLQSHRETTVPHSFICGPYKKSKRLFRQYVYIFLTLKHLTLECHLAAFREVTFLTVLNPTLTLRHPTAEEHMLCTLGPAWPQVVPALWKGLSRAKAIDAK